MTTALIDPQLAAFAASDPSILTPPATPEEHERSRLRLALELAAGFIAMVSVVRAALHAYHDEEHPRLAAQLQWNRHAETWLMIVLPIVRKAFVNAGVTGLSAGELELLATDYATSLGDYLNTTNADALAEGVNRQLNEQWDARVAWQRAVGGYGLERRSMLSYVTAAMKGSPAAGGELISAAARSLAERALFSRADLIGESEVRTATQSGRSLSWLYLQRRGGLPANAARQWRTAHTESECPICKPMDGVLVALDEPFVTPAGRMWAPQAHPNCECEVELVVPVDDEVDKAYNPQERRKPAGSGEGGRWTRVKTAERDAETEARLAPDRAREERRERVAEPVDEPAPTRSAFAPSAPSAFAAPTQSAFTTSIRSAFGADAAPAVRSAFEAAPTQRAFHAPARTAFEDRSRRVNTIVHTLVIPPMGPLPPTKPETYYVSANSYSHITQQFPLGSVWDTLATVNFRSLHPDEELGLLAQQLRSPWDALGQDADLNFTARSEGRPVDQLERAWDEMITKAKPVWNSVMADPETYIKALRQNEHFPELRDIATNAGVEFTDADDMRQKIVDAVTRRGPGNDSLAWAYADYVTFEHPSWVGEEGKELNRYLSQVLSTYLVDFAEMPTQQVFVFDRGGHPGDLRSGMLIPTEDYIITNRTYRSALADMDIRRPRLFSIGLSQAHMSPIVKGKLRRVKDPDAT